MSTRRCIPPSAAVGQKFGRLTVTRLERRRRGRAFGVCDCECGGHATVQINKLRDGHTRSCGCLQSEVTTARNKTHGFTGTPTYRVWRSIIDRCTNDKTIGWHYYGGRGITICARWRNSFTDFLADMGERPTLDHTIDRYPDQNGHYEPGNCRWATWTEQNRNTRRNRYLTLNGRTQTLVAWAEELGADKTTLYQRFRLGWPIERILTTPGRKRCNLP